MSGHAAFVQLLRALKLREYKFTAVTPATHARVLARQAASAPDLRDIFGWSRPFDARDLEPELLQLLERADTVELRPDGKFKSRIRVAALDGELFVHTAFPTDAPDAVFFGPDTYRFAAFVERHLDQAGGQVVDMGAGSGAGGIIVAKRQPRARVTLVDVNERALGFARANGEAAGVRVEILQSETLPRGADLVIANPPYMMDAEARAYRDGGALLGGALALDWVRQFLGGAAPKGRMLLYTGVAFVAGKAPLIEAVVQAAREAEASLSIEELDPDVFGEELDNPAYQQVERIAAVGLVIDER